MIGMENLQVINANGTPLFAVLPYAVFQKLCRRLRIAEERDELTTFPLEVSEMHALKGYSLVKAWRIYRKMTQRQLASAIGVTQGALSQIEKCEHNQAETLNKLAKALNVTPAQLTLDD